MKYYIRNGKHAYGLCFQAPVNINNVLLLTFVNRQETCKWTFQLFMSNIQLPPSGEGCIISDIPQVLQSPQSIPLVLFDLFY